MLEEIDGFLQKTRSVTIEEKEIYFTCCILLVSILLLIIEMFIRVSMLKIM